MLTAAWKRARVRAGMPHMRVHDLKHTFGRRLRAAGFGFEDRQDLLGHKSALMTTHYSAAELTRLIEASETVCAREAGRPELVVFARSCGVALTQISRRPTDSQVSRCGQVFEF